MAVRAVRASEMPYGGVGKLKEHGRAGSLEPHSLLQPIRSEARNPLNKG